jgi:hypothetical protein
MSKVTSLANYIRELRLVSFSSIFINNINAPSMTCSGRFLAEVDVFW